MCKCMLFCLDNSVLHTSVKKNKIKQIHAAVKTTTRMDNENDFTLAA